MRFGTAFVCALAAALPALAQSSREPMNDCSLYRYKSALGEVAADTVDRAIAMVATSKALKAAFAAKPAASATRVEVTETFINEGLIRRDPDCAEPQVRAFVDRGRLEIDVGAQQPEVCMAILADPRLKQRGFASRPLHVPTGKPVCGYSVNFIPKALVLGRATEAGRMISGSNTVTLSKSYSSGPSQCTVAGQVPPSADYSSLIAARPVGAACSSNSLSVGALQCKSLWDNTVTCHGGDPVRECASALQIVAAAIVEFRQNKSQLARMSAGARVTLLEKLMATTQIHKLASVPALASFVRLHDEQTDAIAAVFADGRANMVQGFVAAERPKYARLQSELLSKWVPKVNARRLPGETGVDVWVRIARETRWAALVDAYGIANAELGLKPRRLDAVAGCPTQARNLLELFDTSRKNLGGAYTSPQSGDGRADSIYMCGDGTATPDFMFTRSGDPADYFGDLKFGLETLLHETLHASQMEIAYQLVIGQSAIDAANCTQARMMSAGWSMHCDDGSDACHRLYLSYPHEFQAREFSEAITGNVMAALSVRR